MGARWLGAFAPLALIAAPLWAAPPMLDEQSWNELDVQHVIDPDWSATAILTTRLGVDVPDPTLTAVGLQVDDRRGAWLASATAYRIWTRSATDGTGHGLWLPALAFSWLPAFHGLQFSERNRIEQVEGISGNPVRYRNRIGVDGPLAARPGAPRLFLADEVFYDFSSAHWTRNRLQAGILCALNAATHLQLYLLRQDSRSGRPARLDVLGLTLAVELP